MGITEIKPTKRKPIVAMTARTDKKYTIKLIRAVKAAIKVMTDEMKLHGESVCSEFCNPHVEPTEQNMKHNTVRMCTCVNRNLNLESYLKTIYKNQKTIIRLLVLSAEQMERDSGAAKNN